MKTYTSDDIKKVKFALADNAKLARQAIAHQNKEALNTLVAKQVVFMGIWVDAKLYMLIQSGVFNHSEIEEITKPYNRNIHQWSDALYFAYEHSLQKAQSTRERRNSLHWWEHLHAMIFDRKSLFFTLNLECNTQFLVTGKVSDEELKNIKSGRYENLQSLIFKRNMVDAFVTVIKDFATLTPSQFDESRFKRPSSIHSLWSNKRRLTTMSYEKYEERIRASFLKGKAKRELVK